VDDSRKLESEQRQALVTHITRHLNEQDDQTLLLLADLLHEAPQSIQVVSTTDRSITRRRFLTATLTSGFVAATAGAVAVWEYGSGRGRELGSDLAQAKDEMTRLWGLVNLYEKLDNDSLESILTTGLAAVGAMLEAVAGATDLVKVGAQITEDALIKFETAFPIVRAGITWLEGWVSDLAQRVHLLEDAIGRALNEVSPITQALGGFFNMALGLLPPATAQKIKEVLDRIGEIITLIPQAIADINVKVLTPLRDDWFSDSPNRGLKNGLIQPIITKLLDPLEALLERMSDLARHWEADLTVPVKAALGKRETMRQEIADYKTRLGLHEPEARVSG
jgi:hypothetical protein